MSASEAKLACFGLSFEDLMKSKEAQNHQPGTPENTIVVVHISSLLKLFETLLCPVCKQPSIEFVLLEGKSLGFATKGKTVCIKCQETIAEAHLCERVDRSDSTKVPFEINLRAVLAFRGIGCGFAAIKEWCGIMNMPYSISQDTYSKSSEKINIASKSTFDEIRKQSLASITTAYEELGVTPDEDGILDITVSFDGAWQRWGHSISFGMASVIDLLTGLPIDNEVICNFCHKCKIAADKPHDPVWEQKHKLNCPKNFEGTSNAMEAESALRMWKRSVQKNKLRYTTMLCDGDSKAFDCVVDANVYGEDVSLSKEDCVNHVSKRMGTALRNLVTTLKAQKASISGKGKLTQEKVTKI